MRKEISEKIIDLCPNISAAQFIMSWLRVRRVKSRYISENEIALGEKDPEEKRNIVDRYTAKWKDYLKTTLDLCERMLTVSSKYSDRKDKNDICIDMIFCRLAYGFQPDEYVCFELENQSEEERKKWISDLDRYEIIYRMNSPKETQLLNNKARTYELFGQYYGREAISIKTPKDYDKFERFIKKHPIFVKKQVLEGMGRSIELVDSKDIGAPKDYFTQLIDKGEHVLEEKISQSRYTEKFNASTVNTIRCITFRTKAGIIAPYTFFKVGREGSFVDNGGAGGILVGIDEKTGILNTDGYDEKNDRYSQHPDSGVVFKGYQLPDWNQAISLCKTLSEKLHDVRCIGWDLAHTDSGWVVVEGNGMTQFIVPQIVYKRGIKNEVERIISNMDLIVDANRN